MYTGSVSLEDRTEIVYILGWLGCGGSQMLIMIVMRWPCSSRYFGNLPMSVMRACALQQTKAGYYYVATETCR